MPTVIYDGCFKLVSSRHPSLPLNELPADLCKVLLSIELDYSLLTISERCRALTLIGARAGL